MKSTSAWIAGLVIVVSGSMAIAQSVEMVVDPGEHERRGSLVEFRLPESLHDAAALRLVRIDGGQERRVPIQRVDGASPRCAFVLEEALAPANGRRYRLESAERDEQAMPAADVSVTVHSGNPIVHNRGREVLRYRGMAVEPPAGVDAAYARSGYIHPVRTPGGRIVTGDFPADHRHHHGIWFPWTKTMFEGRSVDFWNSGKKQGRVERVGPVHVGSGPVFGWLRSTHRHVDLSAPGGSRPALEEVWEVRVYAMPEANVFDLVSTQECAGRSPLTLLEYHYGGLGFRGPDAWDETRGHFLTSEGKARLGGHATRARWCAIYGPSGDDGGIATMAILCHPDNFRAPQPMRLHPKEPFFCYAPEQLGEFSIEPGKAYVSRYRFVVSDGEPDPAELDRMWLDYADPPRVRLKGQDGEAPTRR